MNSRPLQVYDKCDQACSPKGDSFSMILSDDELFFFNDSFANGELTDEDIVQAPVKQLNFLLLPHDLLSYECYTLDPGLPCQLASS